MTISLGAITLSDDLRLDGVPGMSTTGMSVRRTFGSPVVQKCPLLGGDQLSLVASMNGNSLTGYFTGAQISAIAVLRDAGSPVALSHYAWSGMVIVPKNALDQLEQVDDVSDPDDTTWYTGQIPLITL